MFNYPPYPPKDYFLKEVPKCHRDSPQFTPDADPRVTQTTLGVFCSPIEYPDGEIPEKIEVRSVNPYIIDKWAKDARAFWVDKPGVDDFFLHDMCKKYSVKFDTYNPAYRHMEKVINRSYKYELVCLEERRLQKLRDKCEREQKLLEKEFNRAEQEKQEEKYPPMKLLGCKAQPPFWWEKPEGSPRETAAAEEPPEEQQSQSEAVLEACRFWTERPCLTASVCDDPCKRKYEMQLVGQPFKSEACNFYYKNHPPPALAFKPKKFC